MRKFGLAAIAASMAAAGPAFAQTAGVDTSSLTGAVDGTVITTAILAVGALMITPRLAKMAIRWVKGSVN